jgi:hypothetical protein
MTATARLVVFCFMVAAAIVALAAVLDRVALNPVGTDAVAYGKVRVIGDPAGAFLNLTPHATLPSGPDDAGLLLVHNISQHLICFRAAGENHCATATLVE